MRDPITPKSENTCDEPVLWLIAAVKDGMYKDFVFQAGIIPSINFTSDG